MTEIRGTFEWHLNREEIITCFLEFREEEGKDEPVPYRTGVSYIFTFKSEEAATQVWKAVNDPKVLVRRAWGTECKEEERTAYKQYLKLKKRFENAKPDSTAPRPLE